jgi:hypothetical protein
MSDEKHYSLKTIALNAQASSFSDPFRYRMLFMHGDIMILTAILRKHDFFQTEIPEFVFFGSFLLEATPFEATPLTFLAGFILP